MRIAEINMTHNGSTGKIMFGIANVARQKNYDVWTFSPKYYSKSQNVCWPQVAEHTYFGTVLENKLHHHFSKLTGLHGCFSWLGTAELIRYLEEIRPDIIHLHNLHNWTIDLPMLFAWIKQNNVRVIWTLHDCWPFTGQCPYFTLAQCERWKTGCHHCPQIHVYPDALVDMTRFMWKQKKKWFTGIKNMTLVTPSQWLADLVKQSFLKSYPVVRISNGIDLNIFKPTDSDFRKRYNLEGKKILLGVAFDWGRRKGLDVFIELARRLDNTYQIVLVGTNEHIDEQLPSNILSIHRTESQQQLAEIYSAADLFVNPTREENYPTVNMEAIACGTPVLTFKTGGCAEILTKETGAVVPCDDIDAIEREIYRICTENPYSKAACLKHAVHFDQESRFKEYVKLYENCTHRT